MAKEYFSHDYNARSDPKMIKLLMKEGVAGIGIYWCIIEMLYEQYGYLKREEYETIAFLMRSDSETIKRVIEDYELFKFDDDVFYSDSVFTRLEIRKDKSKKTSDSAKIRWEKWRAKRAEENNDNAIA